MIKHNPEPGKSEKKFSPPQYHRKMVDGKMVKPESDAYYTIVTKRYSPDTGGIIPKTYFYPAVRTKVEPAIFGLVILQITNGRAQRTIVPWNEVIRWDDNDPSSEFLDDLALWSSENFGMSPAETQEMNDRMREEYMRSAISESMGVDPDSIEFHDLSGE